MLLPSRLLQTSLLQKKRRQNGKRSIAGFSLIELLIVIAIILIILGVALPKLTKSRTFAQEMANSAPVG